MYRSLRTTFASGLFIALLVAGTTLGVGLKEARAQKMSVPSAKSAAYVELAGNGILYTINYDRYFTPKVSGRVGLMRAGAGDVSITAIPLTGNYFIGSGASKLELGVGPQLLIVGVDVAEGETADGIGGFDEEATAIAGTATIGYRYQPRDGGFVFRIGFTPTFSQFGVLPWAGLSLGYSF